MSLCTAYVFAPKWDTTDAEIEDPSVENPELKGSPLNVNFGLYVHRNH